MRPNAVRQVLEAELTAARERAGQSPTVIDVGGGTGGLSVPLAAAGCTVTVIDPNPDALATLHRRAEEAGVLERITGVQGDSEALARLVPAAAADLVIGHGLLEIVDEPSAAVTAMAAAVKPGGLVSVLVANRYAAVLHRAVAGRLDEAAELLADRDGRLHGPGETLQRRFDHDGLQRVLVAAGLVVERVQGEDVLADLVPGSVLEATPGAREALRELELSAATVPPLRDVAARLHAVARRPGT